MDFHSDMHPHQPEWEIYPLSDDWWNFEHLRPMIVVNVRTTLAAEGNYWNPDVLYFQFGVGEVNHDLGVQKTCEKPARFISVYWLRPKSTVKYHFLLAIDIVEWNLLCFVVLLYCSCEWFHKLSKGWRKRSISQPCLSRCGAMWSHLFATFTVSSAQYLYPVDAPLTEIKYLQSFEIAIMMLMGLNSQLLSSLEDACQTGGGLQSVFGVACACVIVSCVFTVPLFERGW